MNSEAVRSVAFHAPSEECLWFSGVVNLAQSGEKSIELGLEGRQW